MHRVARPDDGVLGVAHGLQQRRQRLAHVPCAEPRDQRQPARGPLRIQTLAEPQHIVPARVRAELDAERVVHAREELDVGALRVARPLADPEHVRRAVVPVARRRVAARQRLLVVEQQALVRGPDVHFAELRRVGEVDPARRHEPQRALDLGGDLLVAAPFRRARDELLVPHVDAAEVGEAALRERADEVERRRRLVVALNHPRGIGHPRLFRRQLRIDHVPEEGLEPDAAHLLGRRRARLHELAGDPAHLDDRQLRPEGQHGRHLQQDLQLLADRDRGEVLERLGAVARLEQERAALGDVRERVAERAGLAGEDERRHSGELAEGMLRRRRVGPGGLMARLEGAPGGRRPGGSGHGVQCSERLSCDS